MKVGILAVGAFISFNAAAQAPAPPGHPLLGKWEWVVPKTDCTERYEFRPDGTAAIVSGSEKTDNQFIVAPSPDANGFYRLAIKTTKDHGGKDCEGDESDSTGQGTVNFVQFDPERNRYIACDEPKVEKCYGPLRRITP